MKKSIAYASAVLMVAMTACVYAGNEPMRNQGQSNRDIATTRAHLEGVIQDLGNDDADYGGHKAAAMKSLTEAREHLLQAEQFARQHDR